MKNTTLIILAIVLLAIAFFYFGFGGGGKKEVGGENVNPSGQTIGTTTNVGLANPAAEFCIQNGGTLSGEDCSFVGGKTCNAWGLFRGECIVEGVNNVATYTSATSTLSANFRIKAGTVIINSKELNLNYVELKQAVSGSGARYLSADNKVEFWEHQGEATVSVDGKQVFVGKTSTSCFDQGKEYKNGSSLKTLHDEAGKPIPLIDATNVCESGTWTVVGDGSEGTVPLPPMK